MLVPMLFVHLISSLDARNIGRFLFEDQGSYQVEQSLPFEISGERLQIDFVHNELLPFQSKQ